MENKKLGGILITIALIAGIAILMYNSNVIEQSQDAGCYQNEGCLILERNLNMGYFIVGIFSFVLALGFYLLFFNKTEERIMKRLEDEKDKKIGDEKFSYILKALDPFEKKVVNAVREQDGITQNTLRLRADMSKAKLSYVLQELEKRGLIKRVKKGKTLQVFLKV